MIQEGTFFSLDEQSNLTDGIVLFQYSKYSLFNKFPIYLQISKHSITFLYQEEGDSYVHSELFSLPLSSDHNISDSLTDLIRSIHSESIKPSKNKRGYNCHFKLSSIFNSNQISYSTLQNKFNVPKKHNVSNTSSSTNGYYDSSISNNLDANNNTINEITFKELLLDFIFDLEHSDVFSFSPHFEVMAMRLKSNKYFSLISSKCLFLYSELLFNSPETNRILTEKYIASAKKWHLQIVNEVHEHLFNTEWLCNVEDEYKALNINRLLETIEKQHKNNKDSNKVNENKLIYNRTILWNLRRYNFINAYRLISGRTFLVRFLLSTIFILLTFYLSIYANQTSDSFWQYGLPIILSIIIVKILFSFSIHVTLVLNILLPRLLIAITSGWIIFLSTEELWKSWFDISYIDAILYSIPIIIVLWVYIYFEISNIIKNPIKFWNMMSRTAYLILISFFYSVLIGIVGTTIMSKKLICNSGSIGNYLNNITLGYEAGQPFPNSPWIGKQHGECSKNDTIAYIKTLYLTNQLVDNNKLWVDSSKIFFIMDNTIDSISINSALGIELGFICKEIMLISPLMYKDYRTNELFLKDSVDKIINKINPAILNLYNKRPISNNLFAQMKNINAPNSNIPIFFEYSRDNWKKIKIFPGLLLLNALIAMFFGIFFQLSVQEKTITEPI